jgi:hypothetical protein
LYLLYIYKLRFFNAFAFVGINPVSNGMEHG